MKNVQIWILALLLFVSLSSAQSTAKDFEQFTSDSSSNQLCPQCGQSTLDVSARNFPLVEIYATYSNVTFFTLPEDENGDKSQISNTQSYTQTFPAARARISLYINGVIALNANAEPCELLTDNDGYAKCVVSPKLIEDLSENAILTARLHYSMDDSNIKPSASSPILIKTKNSRATLFQVLSKQVQDPLALPACLPAMVVFGLLIASMQYMGKNPLSLFDITVPKLPNVKKPRMKAPSIPINLALKNRMSARVIARIERSIESQIRSLYWRSGKHLSSSELRELRKLFPYRRGKVGPLAFANDALYFGALDKLKKLIENSGVAKSHKLRAWAVISQGLQAREALAIDMKVTGVARAGDKAGRAGKINATLDYLGKRIAKPWKFFTGDTERADRAPGIPYVERTSLVLQNWIGSRYANIMVRRSLIKTLAAESMRTLGIAKGSNFVKSNIFDGKKVGEIPHIIEKMRQETYIMGRAITDEYMRALIEAISTKKLGKDKFTRDEAGLKKVLQIIKEARAEVAKRLNTDEDKQFRIYHENEEIIKRLATYILNDKNFKMYDALGDKYSRAEVEEFAKVAYLYSQQVRKIIMEDKVASRDGLLPNFSDNRAKLINPQDVKSRYEQIIKMFDFSKIQLAHGRIPLVKVGHDLAELFGTLVDAKISRGLLTINSEAQREGHIRHLMEEELAKKRLFDYIIGTRTLDDKTIVPFSKDGALNGNWLRKIEDAVSVSEIRKLLNYSSRDEWAARNYMTAFHEHSNEFMSEAEKLKINTIRQVFNYQFDKGYLNLFRNSQSDINRNFMIYEGMKSLVSVYNPELKWDAHGYQTWKQKGATFGDIRKGVWVIDANHTMTPMASEYQIDKFGRVIGAKSTTENGYLTYKLSTLAGFMGSDYAERPINASYLVKTKDGKWRPGTPTDRETFDMISQLRGYYQQLTGQQHEVNKKLQQDPAHRHSIIQQEILSQYGHDVSGAHRQQILKNITALQTRLDDRMRLIPRESLAYDSSMPVTVRARKQIVNFLERAARGGVHDVDMRLQEWYASQSYARIALETYQNNFKNKTLLTQEVQESLDAKDRLAAARSDLKKLMTKTSLDADDKKRLNELRTVDIPQLIQNVHSLENEARRVQKAMGWPDRDVKRVADSFIPVYNVMEQTVMRDPRITYGSAYGIGPALMSGYQTGQFVGERPQMWAGYALLPGDRLANILARPSYWATMAFGLYTRTFFTKMTGYSSIYHLDTEKGLRQGSTSQHEQNFIESVQSLFKPWQSFDWFTRLKKPLVRPLSSYKDEFGTNLWDETAWQGKRFKFPLSFKMAGSEDPFEADAKRMRLLGLDVNEEMRRNKLGLTFRDEISLQSTRYSAFAKEESKQIIQKLQDYLKTSTDRAEKRMIKSQIKEIKEIFDQKSFTSKPILRNMFRQGIYSVENRSGYDISGVGAAHRPGEMVWAFHKNINQVPTPGMFYTDFEDRMHMFPFVTATLANPLPGSSLAAMQTRINPDPSTTRLNPQLPTDLPKTIEEMRYHPGVGRSLQAEALRDVYRRETPIFLKFVEVEMERQTFQFHNSPYIFPLAPAYILSYHMFIKKNIPALNNAAWSSNAPKHQYEFSLLKKGLTDEQKRIEESSKKAQEQSAALGQRIYTCPTHGITIRSGEQCSICRNEEHVRMQREQPSSTTNWFKKTSYSAKNWALSSLSLGGSIPIGNYNHYANSATCHAHGIQFERGTVCPLCLQDSVRSGQIQKEEAKAVNHRLKELNKEINKVYTNLKFSEDERSGLIDDKIKEKRDIITQYNMFLNIDKRDMSYKHSREYIRSQQKQSAEFDEKHSYKIKFT